MARKKKKSEEIKEEKVKVPKNASDALKTFKEHLHTTYPLLGEDDFSPTLEQDGDTWVIVMSPYFVLKYPNKWKGFSIVRK